MILLRNLFLWLGGGVPKEWHTSNRNRVANLEDKYRALKIKVSKIQTSVRFGGKCPICGQAYEIGIDITKPIEESEGSAKPIHCLRCKKHPLLGLWTMYHINLFKPK